MKISSLQILLMFLMADLSFAVDTRAQELLNRKVTLSFQNQDPESVLKHIGKTVGIKFMFSRELIKSHGKISYQANNESLNKVLNEILTPLNLTYEVVDSGQQILIKRTVLPVTSDPAKTTGAVQVRKDVELTGKVAEQNGEGLPSVNIVIKSTTRGTISDEKGNFKLNVPEDGPVVLVFSLMGYVTKEVTIDKQRSLDVLLLPDDKLLSEVVVVGYGTQQKATMTGSVSNIAGKDITKSPSPNITSSMAGRLPGLIVNQRSGEPGRDDPSILIRGIGTTGDNSPLIIVDGVQRSLMGRLNPQDIESISVLKDASAAIYGARAANGVILITTKKGAAGKPTFDFSYNYAFQSPTKVPNMLDAATFAEVYNEGDWYRKGRPADYTPFYSPDAIQKFRDGSDPVLYPRTDWADEVLKSYSYQQRMNLQVNGGSEAVRYLLSFGSTDQNGNFKYNPTRYKQYNFRAKIDVELNKNISVGANISGIINDRRYSSTSTGVNFINILSANPTLVARYPNGLIGPGRLGENPLLQDKVGKTTIEDVPLFSTFTASVNIPFIPGLKADASFNYDLSNQFEKTFKTPYSYYEYNVNTKEYDQKNATVIATPELWNYYRKWTTMMYNFRFTYDRTFGQHHVTGMIGTEKQKNTSKSAMAYRKNFVSTAIDQIDVGSNAPADKNNGGSASAGAYNNYFGRFNYDFSSKYLLELVFRYDGSQIFPTQKRYGFFPGISAGWRISEENFFRAAAPFVNQLKVRVSHGQIGNDRVAQYQYLQAYSFGDNYVFGTNDVPGIYPNTMPNPNITWEVSRKTDAGLEATLWNGMLGLEFTWWNQKRSKILARRNLSVSNVFGYPGLPDENIGKVDSHGFELVLNHKNKAGDLTYTLAGNLAFAKSKIIFLDEAPQPEPYQNQTGTPVGSALYYKADGIFKSDQELADYPHGAGTQVGDIRVLDLNNDGLIDSKDQFRFDYSTTPQITFGLNTDFQYKNFDLNIFFQGQTRAYNYDGTAASLGGSDFSNAVVYRATDRWSASNPNGSKPRADMWQPGNTTMFLFDATFVRLKTIELGYSLPSNLVSKIKLSNARIYASAFNLLTWAKEIKWADPEMNGSFTTYPQQRVINLGVSIKF